MEKIRIYHFHNGGGGGVLSVIRNLLRFSSDADIENHVIYTINKDSHPSGYPVNRLDGASSERVFYYSPNWNFYYTCRRLARLLPDDKAIIVAHDWLELGMASSLGLNNPVVQFLHGDYPYYYQLAEKHRSCIDMQIAVSRTISEKLKKLEPERAGSIVHKYFPVPFVKANEYPVNGVNIIYIVRDINDESKNFRLLPAINNLLAEKGIRVHWTVVGTGKTDEEFRQAWGQQENYTYFRGLPNERLLELLAAHHLFILPSFNEGLPVTVVEAMKAGCIPLISDWGGATDELVVDGLNGYYLKPDDSHGYARKIAQLYADRELMISMAANALKNANELFDPYKNTSGIEEAILRSRKFSASKVPQRVYGSRLDQRWIPNFFTKMIRSLNILK
ncbi:MAG TPA: glycosyltransferase family 4 protein [Puia sp.]